MEKRVFPQPAPPVTNVVLPLGKPPPVISSNPEIPVGALGRDFAGLFRFAGVTKISSSRIYPDASTPGGLELAVFICMFDEGMMRHAVLRMDRLVATDANKISRHC
jgi:hypothetical protein